MSLLGVALFIILHAFKSALLNAAFGCSSMYVKEIKIHLLSFLMIIMACDKDQSTDPKPGVVDYRQEMRDFVQAISQYARQNDPDFIVIPQNGQELITRNGESDGPLAESYITAVDGTGREDLFYGYEMDNQSTPDEERDYMIGFCDRCEQAGVEVLVIDYCSDPNKMDDSYTRNAARNYISFAAPDRNLNVIPQHPAEPYNENALDISNLSSARNFLYLINGEHFGTKENFIQAVSETHYDLIIMDCFFNDQIFKDEEIVQLKNKQNDRSRLVVSYMSIGEAEDYRYYWNSSWEHDPPDWLAGENPDWPGNYKVRYWNPAWQAIIYGSENAYLDKILNAGFDGVYLDIIDAFEYFEEAE